MFNGNKQGPFTGFGAEEELSLLNSWLSSDLCEGDLFFDKLYENRRRTVNLKIKNFKARVSNYLYKRKLGSLESKTDIEKSSISSSIQPVLNEIEKQLPTRTQDLDIFKDIISMKYKGYLGKTANSTINGWFVKPTRLIERRRFLKISTKREYVWISKECNEFSRIRSLLPKSYECSTFYKILMQQFEFEHDKSIAPDSLSRFNKFVMNEILLDINEIIDEYELYE